MSITMAKDQKGRNRPADTQQPAALPSEFATDFGEHLRSGYQALTICTSEENRVEQEIKAVADGLGYAMVTWDSVSGFTGLPLQHPARDKKFRDPVNALEALAPEKDDLFKGDIVFVLRDLDDYYSNSNVRRNIRSLCEGNLLVNKNHKRPMVILTPSSQLHPKLKSCLTPLEFRLPDEHQLLRTVEFVQQSVESSDRSKSHCPEPLKDQIVANLRGLTSNESENTLSRCLARHGGFCEDMLWTIKEEKASIIKKSEVLTYIPEAQQVTRDQIGGFDQLLSFVERRRLAYSREARRENLDYPKGVVLIGPPGTGKSVVAAAVARLLGLPGYIMDIGSVFGSLVGESEARMREAIRQVEAQQGCVLLLDEADKAFGGATTNMTDSGVTRRVFGQMLSWLASKQDRTFVIMTLNRTTGIPPEFLRTGRFDAVFSTDLPNESEREQILQIHFKKRGVDPAAMGLGPEEWADVIASTQDFVGSELEEIVRESRYIAFERRQSGVPNLAEIAEATAGIVPLAKLDSENIEAIRQFCRNRARPVTSPQTAPLRRVRERSVQVDN